MRVSCSCGLQLADQIKGLKKWAFPLVVVGMNSIVVYLLAHLFEDRQLLSHPPRPALLPVPRNGFKPFLEGAGGLLNYWLLLVTMYRRMRFTKI